MAQLAHDFKISYPNETLECDWKALRLQLIMQWSKLNSREIDLVGPDAIHLADLIQRKYGIAPELTVNYLRNMARTLPLN